MQETTLQLRVGVTRDRGFLFRTCIRPPTSVTVGRAPSALLHIPDPDLPEEYTLFSVGRTACLLDFRPGWQVKLFRDDAPITGDKLLEEGTAFRRGERTLLQMAPGTRGAIRIGGVRLLFKWEEVPLSEVGEVPLKDVGDVARCHACGLAMRDALTREGLYARCDSCRAMNRFVDPEAPYRVIVPRSVELRVDPADPLGPRVPDVSPTQKLASLEEEADTLLGVPLFAPVTGMDLPRLPQGARPAGAGGRAHTPLDLKAAREPMRALEGMQTVLARSPFLGRRPTRPTLPSSARGHQAGATDHSFDDEEQRLTEAIPAVPASPDAGVDVPSTPAADAAAPPRRRGRLPQQHTAVNGDVLRAAVAGADATADDDQGLWELKIPQTRLRPDTSLRDVSEVTDAGEDEPATDDPGLDNAFYTAELEAMAPRLPDGSVPWDTLSVLSARSEFQEGAGRVHSVGPRPRQARPLEDHAGLLVAVAGLAVLGLGVFLVLGQGAEEPAAAAATPTPLETPVPLTPAPAEPPGRVLLPEGSYVKTAPDDPTPLSVHVPAFRLDRHEVTVAEFNAFLAASGRDAPTAWALHRPSTDGHAPVTGISYGDAEDFCLWAGGRLPTESEWERAAAGTAGRAYPWGHVFGPDRVADGDAIEAVGAHPDGASVEGIHDLVGNAVEWVAAPGDTEPFLKGGGAAPWNRRDYLAIGPRIPASAERWAPGPGFRCASD